MPPAEMPLDLGQAQSTDFSILSGRGLRWQESDHCWGKGARLRPEGKGPAGTPGSETGKSVKPQKQQQQQSKEPKTELTPRMVSGEQRKNPGSARAVPGPDVGPDWGWGRRRPQTSLPSQGGAGGGKARPPGRLVPAAALPSGEARPDLRSLLRPGPLLLPNGPTWLETGLTVCGLAVSGEMWIEDKGLKM